MAKPAPKGEKENSTLTPEEREELGPETAADLDEADRIGDLCGAIIDQSGLLSKPLVKKPKRATRGSSKKTLH